MLSKEEIEESKECLKETIQNTYAEGKAKKLDNLMKYIEQLETEDIDLKKSVEQIYSDYQDTGKKMFEYADKVEELEAENLKLKAKLDNSISKEVIEKKIEEHTEYLLNQAITSNRTLDAHFRDKENYVIKELQELLEGK